MIQYLQTHIEAKRRTNTPRYGMCADGYTKRSGAPSQWLIRLAGEKIWRRVMVLCFSNAGSAFVRVKGAALYLHDTDLELVPEM